MLKNKEIAISCANLSKAYSFYATPKNYLLDLIFRTNKRGIIKDALSNVSFEVKKGEIVGIIGKNGAGKSTLLKILTGNLNANSGEYQVNGRISAILELGSGFSEESTGIENIRMGCLCLGMSDKEINKKIQWIIDFSELGDAIHHPFKTYSSGMKSRLTFATAISVDPEIFIVDEALAAGDAYFVQKCLLRIKEICQSGATVLFVSHSESIVMDLCDKAIWLDKGKVLAVGKAEPVCKAYIKSVWDLKEKDIEEKNKVSAREQAIDDDAKKVVEIQQIASTSEYVLGGESIKIVNVDIVDENFVSKNIFTSGDVFQISVEWEGDSIASEICCSFRIDDPSGAVRCSFEGYEHNEYLQSEGPLSGRGRVVYKIENLDLGMGDYSLSLSLSKKMMPRGKEAILHYIEKVKYFSVKRRVNRELYVPYEPEFQLMVDEIIA
jgi:lipopolysaccharide transport system ATP-binding protein